MTLVLTYVSLKKVQEQEAKHLNIPNNRQSHEKKNKLENEFTRDTDVN